MSASGQGFFANLSVQVKIGIIVGVGVVVGLLIGLLGLRALSGAATAATWSTN